MVIILYPDGNLKTNQKGNNFSQGSYPPFDVLPNSWQFNELFVKDNRIFVMHQIPQIGRIVYATNLNLEHLWNFKLDQQGRIYTMATESQKSCISMHTILEFLLKYTV